MSRELVTAYMEHVRTEMRRAREAARLTTEQLGHLIGDETSTWSIWYREARTNSMSINVLVDTCRALGIRPGDFLTAVDNRIGTVTVNIKALADVTDPRLTVPSRWARVITRTQTQRCEVTIPMDAVTTLAHLSGGIAAPDLIAILTDEQVIMR